MSSIQQQHIITAAPEPPDKREAKLIVAPGTKRSGKTFTTLCKIEKTLRYIPGFQEGRKWLIYDVNKEYSNEAIALHGKNRGRPFEFQTKILALKDLPAYAAQKRPEVRRILPVDENGKDLRGDDIIKTLNTILEEYGFGGLLLEDINGYLIGASTKNIISALTRNAHKDLDIYIHLQSLGKVDPTMFQNADYIRQHYQMDDMSRYYNRLPSPEKYLIAEKLIKIIYPDNPRIYCYVENKLHKITGQFSLFQYQTAVYAYLLDNHKIVDNMIKRTKYSVGGTISPPEAIKRCIMERMHYYGNPLPV